MKRLKFYAPAMALAVIGGASVASAQTSSPIGVSIRAGVVFPTSSTLSSSQGSTWFGFGAEYSVLKLDPSSSLKPTVSISADYFSRDSVSEIPLLLNYVIHSNGLFGSVGAGANFIHTDFDSKTDFGYQVGVGYNFPTTGIPVFLEVKYWGSQDSGYNAVGVYAGVRF
jgi:hypothetical protein